MKIYNTHEPYKCKISIYLFTVHMQSENAGGKTKLCYAKHGKKQTVAGFIECKR